MKNLKNDYLILGVKNFSQAVLKAERIMEENNYYGFASPYSNTEIESAYNILYALEELENVERAEEKDYEYM